MEINKSFENYPLRIVLLSNLVSLTIYLLGFVIILRLGMLYAVIYLLYVLLFEFRLIRYHCINCYYWGKTCAFGRGRISGALFRKGDNLKFCKKEIKWSNMLPDMLFTIIPLIVGIIYLILDFKLVLLAEILFLIILTTKGNEFIRGSLACKNCKQKELGCPAIELFNKKANQ